MKANVHILQSNISDNVFYLVHDHQHALLIDPIDAELAVKTVQNQDVELAWVVNTHFHHDHTAGNDAVLDAFPNARLCSGTDHLAIKSRRAVELVLEHGSTLQVGTLNFNVLHTPGHTPGHISLTIENHLFCGDTIFVAGAGNCSFSGDPHDLFTTFRDVIAPLPGETLVYPGHDYAIRNVAFALSLEPDRPATLAAQDRIATRKPCVPVTLAEERTYNPFMRAHDPDLIAAVRTEHAELWATERDRSADDAEATFRTARTLRNSW